MGDDYLDRLKATASHKSKVSRDFKQGYREMSRSVEDPYSLLKNSELLKAAERFLGYHREEPNTADYSKGNISKLASELMSRGIKNKDLKYSFKGLELYNVLGLANKKSVINRFNIAAELDPQEKYLTRAFEMSQTSKGTSGTSENNNNLEGKAISGILILSVLGGMFFLSPNLTGNVIGNMARSSSNTLGLILFVVGIMGVFIKGKVK